MSNVIAFPGGEKEPVGSPTLGPKPDPTVPEDFDDWQQSEVLDFITDVDGIGDLTEEEFWPRVAQLHRRLAGWLQMQGDALF